MDEDPNRHRLNESGIEQGRTGCSQGKAQPALAPSPPLGAQHVSLPREHAARGAPETGERDVNGDYEDTSAAMEVHRRKDATQEASSKRKRGEGDKEEPCPVCRDELPDYDRGIIRCGHVFCFECIHRWSKRENSCPQCRNKFSSIVKTITSAQDEAIQKKYRGKKDEDLTKTQRKRRNRLEAKRKRLLIEVQAEEAEDENNTTIDKDRRKWSTLKNKTIRIRPSSQARTLGREQAFVSHPQAPRGHLHRGAESSSSSPSRNRTLPRVDHRSTIVGASGSVFDVGLDRRSTSRDTSGPLHPTSPASVSSPRPTIHARPRQLLTSSVSPVCTSRSSSAGGGDDAGVTGSRGEDDVDDTLDEDSGRYNSSSSQEPIVRSD